MVNAARRFARTSVLRFQTAVYNAAPPDVEIEARVLRGGHTVLTMPATKLPTVSAPDPARLPYWAEIDLGPLSPGKYVLQVTAIDRGTKSRASQQASFVVE